MSRFGMGAISALLGKQTHVTAVEEFLDADRRAVAERVAEIFRWIFLFVLLVLNNFGGIRFAGVQLVVDGVLGVWALGNLLVTILLSRGYKPGPQFGLATMVVDILAGAALIYFSNGLTSPYILALFLAIIASAVRFGLAFSLVCALVVSFIYLFVGGTAPTLQDVTSHPQLGLESLGNVFLFLVVALVTGLIGDELIRERRLAISRAAQAEALQQMSSALAYSLDVNDLFEVVLQQAVRITSAETGALVLNNGGRLQLAAYHGRGGRSDKAAMAKGDALIEKVLTSGDAIHIKDERHPDARLLGMQPPFSVIVVPISVQNRVAAVLRLSHYNKSQAFTDQQFFLVNALAGSASGALANSLRYERKTREAITDGLTGLLNHREFRHRLDLEFSRFRRRGTPFSVMLIDVDHFKSVNDTMGHRHGDEILKAAGDLVRKTTRDHDLVARYGGDEIAVILPDTDQDQARSAAERMIAAVRRAKIPATPARDLTFSIGVGSAPGDAIGPDELVMAADQALYFAKRSGRDCSAAAGQLSRAFIDDPRSLLAAINEAGPQIVVAVARSMDAYDPAGEGHSSRIAAFAETLVKKLGRPEGEAELIRSAALMHESGRVLGAVAGVQKGHRDWETDHPMMDEDVVRRGRFLPELAEILRHHHECWDGSGSPDGLRGDDIPLLARILGVAEAFEAMVRAGLSPLEAADRLNQDSGKVYDPHVLEGLNGLVGEGERLAAILRTPPVRVMRPVEATAEP
ncbi:MAG TPA: diguanylate cyclase [Candidatus Dormibacteraeota bacterium]|nr:diguanylate cyclase [Candidatus Dormibacteraeota bacterium]